MFTRTVFSLQRTNQQPGLILMSTCVRSPAAWSCPGESTSLCRPRLSLTKMESSACEFFLRNTLKHSAYLLGRALSSAGEAHKGKVRCGTHILCSIFSLNWQNRSISKTYFLTLSTMCDAYNHGKVSRLFRWPPPRAQVVTRSLRCVN